MTSSLFDGTRESQFRERSNNASMAGVSITPKLTRCQSCGKLRTTQTGSYSKTGKFTCGQCRPVFARIADKTTATS